MTRLNLVDEMLVEKAALDQMSAYIAGYQPELADDYVNDGITTLRDGVNPTAWKQAHNSLENLQGTMTEVDLIARASLRVSDALHLVSARQKLRMPPRFLELDLDSWEKVSGFYDD